MIKLVNTCFFGISVATEIPCLSMVSTVDSSDFLLYCS